MIMRDGGQEARNNNAKEANSAKSFSYVFVLFTLFVDHKTFAHFAALR